MKVVYTRDALRDLDEILGFIDASYPALASAFVRRLSMIERRTTVAGHTTIYFPAIRAFHIALPSVAEQHEIDARIEAARARTDRLEAEAVCVRALLDRTESAILAKAFRGELVPQDPNDEPASVLLEASALSVLQHPNQYVLAGKTHAFGRIDRTRRADASAASYRLMSPM